MTAVILRESDRKLAAIVAKWHKVSEQIAA